MIRGSCLCGEVAFEIHGKTTEIGMCHCSKCRKVSGVASNASIAGHIFVGSKASWDEIAGDGMGSVIPFIHACVDNDSEVLLLRPLRSRS